jgi:heavy metal translocating P-type ATPase
MKSDAGHYPTCAHCGLPVTAVIPEASPEAVFCCRGCLLVSKIVGNQAQGQHAWNLLRLGLGALLAMNVMMISLLLYSGSVGLESFSFFRFILLALSTAALVVLIPPLLTGAAREFASRKLSLDTLVAGGSLTAYLLSSFNVLAGNGELYFDTATTLPVLVTIGKLIEATAKTRAADLLQSLETLLPATALRLTPEGAEEVPIGDLQPGDIIRVRPGERLPVDGEVTEGTSSIEAAAFTGEFLPRACRPGDWVSAGTVNGTGTITVKAARVGEQLLLHGILSMVRDAWSARSPSERFAQKAAGLLIPLVLLIAGGTFVYWAVTGSLGSGLLNAIAVLVVACPCTMGIATPLATSLAIARAAKAGIVVRGGEAMEILSSTDTVFFDKTGTITVGAPQLDAIDTLHGTDAAETIGRAAALELTSSHPLAKAVVDAAAAHGIQPGSATQVLTVAGFGLSGEVNWQGVSKDVYLGSARGLSDAGVERDTSDSVVEVAWDGEVKARLFFRDSVRAKASSCVAALAQQGVKSILLSGDRHPAAAAVAKEVGINMVDAPRTPGEKAHAIAAAVAEGRKVAMVGDGVNDAPALAAAQVGIAMGGGMELAKQAGNVVILSSDLMQIPWLLALSKKTLHIVHSNFAWSFGYNAIALAAAAAGLLHPLLAAMLMVVSSLTVLGNSLRIARFTI